MENVPNLCEACWEPAEELFDDGGTMVCRRCYEESLPAVRFERAWAMPNGRTFTIGPIRNVVRDECLDARTRGGEDAVVVDPFARDSAYGTVTNDLDPDMPTDYHMDALAFLRTLDGESADLVLYDPPYSITQAAQLYKSFGKDKLEVSVSNMAYWARCKDECARILKHGGVALCCGWNTNGLGKGRGFRMERVLMVAHGGSKNDTLVTVERKL